jgi:hypothetical protein
MSKWQYVHIFDELKRAGHNITVYNPLSYSTFDESNENLIPYIKKSRIKFDLFLNCEGDGFLYASSVKAIHELGLPTVLICFDNLHAPHLHKRMAHLFDIVWLTSHETKWMFEKWGCKNIIFQPYAANPFAFKPSWKTPTHSVCFIGSPYGSRTSILNLLTHAGIKCDVYTDKLAQKNEVKNNIQSVKVPIYKEISQSLSFEIGRKVLYSALLNRSVLKQKSVLDMNDYLSIHPSVSFDDMQQIYSNNSLSLNITILRFTYLLKNPIHKIHLRTFEIPMCGGLEIAPFSAELAGYFEDGKEIVLYKNNEEFLSKAKFYSDPQNDSLSLKMKQNARERAENDHSWTKRFNVVFSNLNV